VGVTDPGTPTTNTTQDFSCLENNPKVADIQVNEFNVVCIQQLQQEALAPTAAFNKRFLLWSYSRFSYRL
jgi:hypothetical protein